MISTIVVPIITSFAKEPGTYRSSEIAFPLQLSCKKGTCYSCWTGMGRDAKRVKDGVDRVKKLRQQIYWQVATLGAPELNMIVMLWYNILRSS